MREAVIYRIICLINNKIYIGSSVDYKSRKRAHLNDLKRNGHHSITLQRAWNKYGKDNFIFEIIERIVDVNSILEREQYYLDIMKPYDKNIGYNIYKTATNTFDYKLQLSTKEKMRIAKTGAKRGKCSDEARKNISMAQLNRDKTESVKKRIKTLLTKDENIFKLIGIKSSKTQIENEKHKGTNNQNYNSNDLIIYNDLNEIMYVTKNMNFNQLCIDNNLPYRALNKSKLTNGDYKLYSKCLSLNKEFLKYRGWYCKYNGK